MLARQETGRRMRILKNTRHGMMSFMAQDRFIGASLLHYGEYAPVETDHLLALVDSTSIVIDVGANIGCLTVPLAKKAHGVWAFEPQRLSFQMLCANLALNDLENVIARPQAVGAKAASLRLKQVTWNRTVNSGNSELKADGSGDPTDVVALDSLGLQRCDLIKIDVEGLEAEVLEGARATLARCRPTLFLEADRPDRTPALIALVKSLGYRPYWDNTPLFSPNNFHRNQHNLWKNTFSFNLLCIPAEKPTPDPFGALPEARDGDTHKTFHLNR
jgi:FkbM family methyltransferase